MTATPTSSPRGETARTRIRELLSYRESGVFLALVIFFVVMYTVSPIFRSPFNLTTILRQISVTSIMAMGQTLVIVSGSFDLSQASIAGLAAMVTARLWKIYGLSPPFAIAGGLGVGILCGFLNGMLAARFRLHPIVMTLATGAVFLGVNFYITRGESIVGLPVGLVFLGQGRIFGIPALVILMFIVAILMHIMLTRTLFGLRVRMIGGNLKASQDMGMNVERIRVGIFTLSGFLSALGGIVLLGLVGNAVPQIGQGLLFPVVTAAIVGGTLLTGGVGSMAGTLIGAAIMGITRNALVVLQMSIYLQDIVQGALVVVALLVDQFRRGELTWRIILGLDR